MYHPLIGKLPFDAILTFNLRTSSFENVKSPLTSTLSTVGCWGLIQSLFTHWRSIYGTMRVSGLKVNAGLPNNRDLECAAESVALKDRKEFGAKVELPF